MLVSIIERFQGQGECEVDRYAAWSAALRQLREDFETGEQPALGQLRDYLEDVPEQQRSEALQDLITEHLQLTWEAGRGRNLESYLAEFGDELGGLDPAPSMLADLVEGEFLARYQLPHGDRPAMDEYRRRFPGRYDVASAFEWRSLDGGCYVKLRHIGKGAMGEVWETYDRQSECPVALKEPVSGAGPDERAEALKGFAEEARVTAELEHPGIANLHEHPSGGGRVPIYTMRLVRGERFSDRIGNYHHPSSARGRRERRTLRNELLQAFVAVCDAIAYAHANGVLHRDLKPGNIVVEESGRAVILDWGMATPTAQGGSRSTAVVAGTPDYMPPEQADGIADTRSDVFGLGAILYEILTGRPPHVWSDGVRPAEWLEVVRQAQIVHPRRLNRRTPRALAAACMKALAREPDGRYQSAADLAREVERLSK